MQSTQLPFTHALAPQCVLSMHATQRPCVVPIVEHCGVGSLQSSCLQARQVLVEAAQIGVPEFALHPALLVGLHWAHSPVDRHCC
jgi:hypothetical protein